MHKRGLCRYAVYVRLSVRLSVCPSHWRILSKQMYLQFFSPSDSHTILDFPYQTLWQYSDGDPHNGGVECRWGSQKSHFSINIWLADRGLVECDQQLTIGRAVVYGSERGRPFTAEAATHQ